MASDKITTQLPAEVQLYLGHLKGDLPDVYAHCVTTAVFCWRLGSELRRHADDRHTLSAAGLLHDVGKKLIPTRIIEKPSELTDLERRIMRRHPGFAASIIDGHPSLTRIRSIVYQHHERYDGCGYPNGLNASEVEPLALALAVVDAFSALTEDRAYHRAISASDALTEIANCAGTQFDPYFVEVFATIDHRQPSEEERAFIEDTFLPNLRLDEIVAALASKVDSVEYRRSA